MEELTPREYEALSLVNEKIIMDGSKLAHLMYGNQSGMGRACELLAHLTFSGLIEMYQTYPPRFTCTEKGEEYLRDTPKPVKPFAF